MRYRYTVTDPAGVDHSADTPAALDLIVADLEARFCVEAEFEYQADVTDDDRADRPANAIRTRQSESKSQNGLSEGRKIEQFLEQSVDTVLL